MEELEQEDEESVRTSPQDCDDSDDPDDPDYEPEAIQEDSHNSDTDTDFNSGVESNDEDEAAGIKFYIA